jgi:hypothetical protein
VISNSVGWPPPYQKVMFAIAPAIPRMATNGCIRFSFCGSAKLKVDFLRANLYLQFTDIFLPRTACCASGTAC